MILECHSQSVNCIESSRRNVIERSPVVRDEVSGLESLEKSQRIATREMTFAESGLPPRRMPDWQESEIQIPSFCNQVVLDEVCRIGGEGRISGKEA